jgi:hypothetical protein
VSTASAYNVACLAAEGLLARALHRWADRWAGGCTRHRPRGALPGYILPCLLLALCYNVPQFLLYTTEEAPEG